MWCSNGPKTGEIDPRRDLDTLAFVVPEMIAYRLIVVGQPIDGAFIRSIIDEIVLPASGYGIASWSWKTCARARRPPVAQHRLRRYDI
jgi:hypothetical protein